MPTFVLDCPRCLSKSTTFDVVADTHVGCEYNWVHLFEICAVCRRCLHPSLAKVSLNKPAVKDRFRESGSMMKYSEPDLSSIFSFRRFVHLADIASLPAPPDLPAEITKAFEEGTRCLAVEAPNAASAMFRLCLDIASKSLLPPEDQEGGPDKQSRRNLAPRLRWLFDNRLLPADLKALSSAVKDHGDEGAHEGCLDQHDAEDIYDFAFALLDRLYSEPARIEAATARRAARRQAS